MEKSIDRVNFILTLSVMLAMAIPLLLLPEASALVLETAYNFLATELGWLYILTAIVAFCAVLFLHLVPMRMCGWATTNRSSAPLAGLRCFSLPALALV